MTKIGDLVGLHSSDFWGETYAEPLSPDHGGAVGLVVSVPRLGDWEEPEVQVLLPDGTIKWLQTWRLEAVARKC